MDSPRLLPLLYSFLLLLGRLSPHLPNMAPATSASLMSGNKFNLWKSLWVIFPALFISDYFLGFYDWHVMAAVYVSYLLIICLGRLLQPTRSFNRLLGTTILASLLFFFITNFAVWAFTPFYTKTLAGLSECLTLALPFFRNSLLGDLLYSCILYQLEAISFKSLSYSRS